MSQLEARGKPSTWLPRGGLVEHIFSNLNQPTNRPKTSRERTSHEPTGREAQACHVPWQQPARKRPGVLRHFSRAQRPVHRDGRRRRQGAF